VKQYNEIITPNKLLLQKIEILENEIKQLQLKNKLDDKA
jgi:hypothetical protein